MAGTSTTLIAAIAALAAGVAEPEAARHDPVAAASEAIAAALVPIGLADALAERCRSVDPAGNGVRAAALADWRRRNAVRPFEVALAAVAARAPELTDGHGRMRAAAAAQAAETIARDPAACRRLPQTLADPHYRIAPVTTRAAPLLHRLAAALDRATARHLAAR